MHTAYLLLGANLGDRERQMQAAREAVGERVGVLLQSSALYETPAWGTPVLQEDRPHRGSQPVPQPDYLNQVLIISTSLSPEQLLRSINRIEDSLGRVRTVRWGSRVIDIDILFYEDQVIDLPHLQIPHPYFQYRRFALEPMYELAPDFIHPVLHKTVAQLLEETIDHQPDDDHQPENLNQNQHGI